MARGIRGSAQGLARGGKGKKFFTVTVSEVVYSTLKRINEKTGVPMITLAERATSLLADDLKDALKARSVEAGRKVWTAKTGGEAESEAASNGAAEATA